MSGPQMDEPTRTFLELFRRLAIHFRMMGFLEGLMMSTALQGVHLVGVQLWGWEPVTVETLGLLGLVLMGTWVIFMTRKQRLID